MTLLSGVHVGVCIFALSQICMLALCAGGMFGRGMSSAVRSRPVAKDMSVCS